MKNAFVLLTTVGLSAALPHTQTMAATSENAPPIISVSLPSLAEGDASGRLLVFARPLRKDESAAPGEVDGSENSPAAVAVAGRYVATFGPNRSVTIDLDATDTSTSFAALPSGQYVLQAVLDRNNDYGRFGRGPGDLVSKVLTVQIPLQKPIGITLDHALPAVEWDSTNVSPDVRARREAARPFLTDVEIPSPSLTKFSGRPVRLRAWVLVPPNYHAGAKQTWPVAFMCGTFSANRQQDLDLASLFAQMNQRGSIPPLIWVFLDYATITGATEFADGVNNGPWGTALTTELIPALEQRFRMDARPSGRLLIGHSSGGWASLWLQINYPYLFGGAWATAPDPSDFRDFVGVDLTMARANMYYDDFGNLRPLIRSKGQVTGTIKDFVRLEETVAHTGGTFQSFDWVFSPRGPDGRPLPMFDRVTGAVDPNIVSYWRSHYDIGRLIVSLSEAQRRALDGKLRVIVGDADTFYLDGSVHRLQRDAQTARLDAKFRFLPGKTHNDLFAKDGDSLGLLKEIAWEMHAVARPH